MTGRSFDTSEAPQEWWEDFLSGNPTKYERALDLLVRHYQFLVEGIAHKFKTTLPSWISDDDLRSYGQIGLLKAMSRYDPESGAFSKFASTIVRGAILDELRSQDWAPRNLRRDQREIRKATKALATDEGTPSVAAVAAHLGWEEARLESTIQRVNNSHHQTLDGVEYITDDHAEPESVSQTTVLLGVFVDTLETFPTLTQYIIARVYFGGETLTQVAEGISLPLTTVRRMHSEAVAEVLAQVESAAVLV